MKPGRNLPIIGIVVLCIVAWGLLQLSKPSETATKTPDLRNSSVADRAAPSSEETSRSSARRGAANETARDSDRLLNLLDRDSSTEDEANELLDLMGKAAGWNRKELRSLIEKLMEKDLSSTSNAHSVAELLVILSSQDPEGALALYDQLRKKSGFKEDWIFSGYKLVFNLADQDPERALQWVEARQDTLPREGTEVLLEKLREKIGR